MLVQLRHIFKVYSGSTPESGKGFYWDGDIPWVTPEDVTQLNVEYRLGNTNRKITEEGYQNTGVTMVPENSIVLTKRAPIGHLAILDISACCNQGCFLLVPKQEVIPEFYYYFFLANRYNLQILGRGSTFMELSLDDLKSFQIPKIPFQAQRKIVDYLKNETYRIDSLIKAKEEIITSLFEKRQSLIVKAVTKGLNASSRLKDSGVEWLGDIPIHWKVLQLKYVCSKIKTGGTPSAEWIDVIGETIVDWYTPSDFQNKVFLNESTRKLSDEAIAKSGFNVFPKGTVLVIGIGATLGKVGIVDSDSFCNQQINALLPKENVSSIFLAYLLSTMEEVMKIYANTATLPILNQQRMGSLSIGLPPLKEQEEIASYLLDITTKIDRLSEATLESIDLLTKRRESIIDKVVSIEF